MNRLIAVALRCSGALKAHAARALTLALFLAAILIAGAAGAQGRVVAGAAPPTIDGNINDLISYAAGIGQGCLDTENLPIDARPKAGDVCKTNALLIPCNATQVACLGGGTGTYFLNGYDLTRAVVAYDRANQTLYLGIRVAGVIGDANGDGTPDAAAICSPPLNPGEQRIGDPAGIGPGETYLWNLDTNCDGVDDITIGITSGVGGVATVFVSGAGGAVGSGAYVGSDLEVKVTNIALPFLFTMNSFSGATPDGLSEDATNRVSCGPPDIDVEISKVANPPAICAGGTTTFTISVQNTGDVPVTATLTDDLPAELAFDDNVTGDFTLNNQAGQHLTFNDLVIPVGATRTVSFRVKASAECFGSVRNNAKVVAVFSEPCVDFANGGVPLSIEKTTFADVLCKAGPCVTVTCTPNKTSACEGEPIELTVRGTNCGSDPASITLRVGDQSFTCAEPVAVKGFCEHVFTVIMPKCTDGQDVTFPSEATITNDCSSVTVVAPSPCTVRCKEPNIDITKEAEAQVDPGGTIHYKITVTNQSKVTDLEKVKVIDTLCDFVKDPVNFAGDCAGAPLVEGKVITWPEFNLAAGASCTLTFDVTAVGDAEPCTHDVTCVNDVTVTGYCADASATASSSASTLIPCSPPGLCRLTGGGCLNEDGDQRGHKQSTFGGNSSPAHEGGGPTGNEWEHVYRDGRTILFNWHSHDAHVIACSVVPPGPCHPAAENTRADFVGTGLYSIGAGGREEEGNMVAYIIDHKEGACNKNNRDEYSIIVREGLVIGEGAIVFQTSGEIDCGNLQIHETPARIFGSGASIPGTEVGQVSESVALLNRAYPNPFSTATVYNYRVVGASSAVEVGVYNVAGRLVKTLASGPQSQGTYTVTWNGTDEAGVRMAPGVYFLKSRVDAESNVNRIIYLAK